ncbi:MAG: hypothetical protein NC091_08430 [Bacteroides sp.]|nr:hypothetical protein [Bacteroides sp.]
MAISNTELQSEDGKRFAPFKKTAQNPQENPNVNSNRITSKKRILP